ncbi:hypothetical protein EMIT0P176_280061 [Pseudomonas sp. IT-P176]
MGEVLLGSVLGISYTILTIAINVPVSSVKADFFLSPCGRRAAANWLEAE